MLFSWYVCTYVHIRCNSNLKNYCIGSELLKFVLEDLNYIYVDCTVLGFVQIVGEGQQCERH